MNCRRDIALLLLALSVLPIAAHAEVLFSDNFDKRADWSVPYTLLDQTCNRENGCNDIPKGYYGYYISRSVIRPTTGNGLHLNSTNKRGPKGKGVTFWDQSNGTMSWTSGMQVGISFPAQKEVYLRYWMKMQPGYRYYKGDGRIMMRKLNHISHYVHNGKPFAFFSQGGHHPTTVNQVRFGNARNLANLQMNFFIRPDPHYGGRQKITTNSSLSLRDPALVGVYNYFDLPDDGIERGNYNGTGTEYDSAGMLADGQWHCLEFYLQNNSAPGIADGEYGFWLDGVPQIEAHGLLYRDTASTLPEKIWNFVHLGGNALNPFAGLNVTGEQWYAIDDVVISTTYSGPPPRPGEVRAKVISDSAVKVTWKPGTLNTDYPLDGYRVYYGIDPAQLTQSVTVPASATEATVSGLSNPSRYHFGVTAFNKGSTDENENQSLLAKASRGRSPLGSLF